MISLTPDQAAKTKELIATDDSLLPLFPPVERAVILALKDYFRGRALWTGAKLSLWLCPASISKASAHAGAIQEKNDLQIIPFKTLFFVFEEFRLSHAKAKYMIGELEKVG